MCAPPAAAAGDARRTSSPPEGPPSAGSPREERRPERSMALSSGCEGAGCAAEGASAISGSGGGGAGACSLCARPLRVVRALVAPEGPLAGSLLERVRGLLLVSSLGAAFARLLLRCSCSCSCSCLRFLLRVSMAASESDKCAHHIRVINYQAV